MSLSTDDWPAETTWDLKDTCDGNKIVASGGPYAMAGETYTETKSLDSSRYTLTVRDSYGKNKTLIMHVHPFDYIHSLFPAFAR